MENGVLRCSQLPASSFQLPSSIFHLIIVPTTPENRNQKYQRISAPVFLINGSTILITLLFANKTLLSPDTVIQPVFKPVEVIPGLLGYHTAECQDADQVRDRHEAVEDIRNGPYLADSQERSDENG